MNKMKHKDNAVLLDGSLKTLAEAASRNKVMISLICGWELEIFGFFVCVWGHDLIPFHLFH